MVIKHIRVRIILSLLLSFFLVIMLGKFLFVSNRPVINKAFISSIPKNILSVFKTLQSNISLLFPKSSLKRDRLDIAQQPINWYFEKPKSTPTSKPILTKIPKTTSSPTAVNPTKSAQTNQTIFRSKLSIFILNSLSAGAKQIIKAGPPVVKVMDPSKSIMSELKNYKQTYAGAKTLVRFYHQQGTLQAWETDDPITYAEKYFNTVDGPRLAALGDYKQYIDYVTGPNEFEDLPYPWKMPGEPDNTRSIQRSEWNGKFWLRLAQLESSAGVKTCILNVPVGNLGPTELGPMIPYLKQMNRLGAAICYHDYAATSPGTHHYRTYYDYFKSVGATDLLSIPLIIGELGVATDSQCGYKCVGISDQSYEQMLAQYDNIIMNEPYVLGATIFQIGDTGTWNSFNVESIAGWLANRLSSLQ